MWSARPLIVEESQTWVNLHDDLEFVKGTGEFTWSSERSGYRHLYLYRSDGTLAREVTHGEWPVDGVRGIDAEARLVFFAGWMDTPVERHLCRVALDGGDPVRLTREPGMHDGVVARDGRSFVDCFDSRSQPPTCVVRQQDGTPLWTNHAPSTIDLYLPAPELHSFQIRNGTTLHAAVYRPPQGRHPDPPSRAEEGTRAGKRMPVIVAVYGGPHVQTVTDSWGLTVDLRAQLLAAEGFAVLKVDNRGSARRGVAFESAIHRRMGDIEVQDQMDGVRWLAGQEATDLERVGVYGWSYGGYAAAMLLLRGPELFKVGVAGAPVTSWDGYDTAYTERYMGTPATNPKGYRDGSVMTHVDRLQGKLLLVHGMLDENVHFRHTARLMQALIDAGKPFDVLLYPNERHGPRAEKDRVAMERQILEHFKTHLLAGPTGDTAVAGPPQVAPAHPEGSGGGPPYLPPCP